MLNCNNMKLLVQFLFHSIIFIQSKEMFVHKYDIVDVPFQVNVIHLPYALEVLLRFPLAHAWNNTWNGTKDVLNLWKLGILKLSVSKQTKHIKYEYTGNLCSSYSLITCYIFCTILCKLRFDNLGTISKFIHFFYCDR